MYYLSAEKMVEYIEAAVEQTVVPETDTVGWMYCASSEAGRRCVWTYVAGRPCRECVRHNNCSRQTKRFNSTSSFLERLYRENRNTWDMPALLNSTTTSACEESLFENGLWTFTVSTTITLNRPTWPCDVLHSWISTCPVCVVCDR